MRFGFPSSVATTVRSFIAIYLIVTPIVILFAVLYVSHEHPSYVWDRSVYWVMLRDAGDVAKRDFVLFLQTARASVANSDYNVLGAVPLLPVYLVFGGDRTVYVAAVCALYVVPAAFVAAGLASKREPGAFPGGLAIGSALLMPVFWNAAMRGMIDAVALIPLGISAILIWKTRFLTTASLGLAVLLGFLFWLTFGLRRWYAFSLVALIILSVLGAVIVMVQAGKEEGAPPFRPWAIATFDRWLYAGCAALLCLSAFQLPLLVRILNADYTVIYSAYQRPTFEQITFYTGEFGPVILFFVLLGLTVDLWNRRWKSPFFFLAALLTALLFARVQAPTVHHLLPVALMVFPAGYAGISFTWDKLPGRMRFILPLALVLNFANNFLPASSGQLQSLRTAMGGPRYPPLWLDNYGEYRRLTSDLLELDEDNTFAVLGSSWEFTGDLFVSMENALRPRLIPIAEVDLRDGFSPTVLSADFVLIGRPTPLHLNPADQQVVSIPAGAIADGTGIGAHFAFTGKRYMLSGGVTAELYRRVRPIPASDIRALQSRFYEVYPQWRAGDSWGP